jgi:hypothetical protein
MHIAARRAISRCWLGKHVPVAIIEILLGMVDYEEDN